MAISELAERRRLFICLILKLNDLTQAYPTCLSAFIILYDDDVPDEVIIKGDTDNYIDRKRNP
jgi:hypothetical protein